MSSAYAPSGRLRSLGNHLGIAMRGPGGHRIPLRAKDEGSADADPVAVDCADDPASPWLLNATTPPTNTRAIVMARKRIGVESTCACCPARRYAATSRPRPTPHPYCLATQDSRTSPFAWIFCA